jgi:16S rRNA (cytidine1402-2'-O)-methyltransferase
LSDIKELQAKCEQNLTVKPSTLYIVSTPIGNLEDISFRALFYLKNVNFILCEDSRVTQILLRRYEIRNEIISYYSRIESSKSELIIERLKKGECCALVSDAGTPLISDPGSILISECIANGINLISAPGASSVIHSIVKAQTKNKNFYFQGFLPTKNSRTKTLEELSGKKVNIIIFESKYKLERTLRDILSVFGNKDIIIFKELTKKFEFVIQDKVKILLQNIARFKKGEFTLIIKS